MSTIKELESAIRGHSSGDLAQLRAWFAAFDADTWDRQIEGDSRNGRLDALYQRLQQENDGETDVPLHAFLDEEKLP